MLADIFTQPVPPCPPRTFTKEKLPKAQIRKPRKPQKAIITVGKLFN